MLFQSCINALEIHGASSCFRSQDTQFTTGNPIVAECRPLCRVPKVEHSATREYTECYPENTRQHFDTRQICLLPSAGTQTHGKIGFCRVPCLWHSAKTARARHVIQRRPNAVTEVVFAECLNSALGKCTPLPSVRFKALGIVRFCRVSESMHSAN